MKIDIGLKHSLSYILRITQNPHNPSLSRFEVFPNAQTFCGKPDPLFYTIFRSFCNLCRWFQHAYRITESYIYIQGSKYIFPAINVSNNFATIDSEAHINTKINYTINHVFRTLTVQEINTLHTECELERNQLLTILAMSVRNPQLAGIFLTGNRSNFFICRMLNCLALRSSTLSLSFIQSRWMLRSFTITL